MSLKQKLKNMLAKIQNGPIKKIVGLIIGLILLLKTILFSRLTFLLVGVALGFVFGVRLNEVGTLDGHLGKTLKGSTVYISGPCKINGTLRSQILGEDEVKITGEEDGMLTGVIRKTREFIACDPKITSIDKLPVLNNWTKAPSKMPELEAMKVDEKEPDWKKLVQKTLIMSGSCLNIEGKALPPFTDELVDVTDVEQSKDDPTGFNIAGIKKSDKIAILCKSTSVKYSIYEQNLNQPVSQPVEEPKVKSYVGENILVTGKCFPDPRTPKYAGQPRVAFYPLINAKVQVNEESLDSNGKLKKFVGAVLTNTDENKRAVFVVCDMAKIPFTYKEFDSDNMKLAPITESNDEKSRGSVVQQLVPVTPQEGAVIQGPSK
jgi:hypothetical protein